jgi:hypothetical protein
MNNLSLANQKLNSSNNVFVCCKLESYLISTRINQFVRKDSTHRKSKKKEFLHSKEKLMKKYQTALMVLKKLKITVTLMRLLLL